MGLNNKFVETKLQSREICLCGNSCSMGGTAACLGCNMQCFGCIGCGTVACTHAAFD